MIPMLSSVSEIHATLRQLDLARVELDNRGVLYGALKVGAMIELPAAALMLGVFLKHFDFLSLGTNDLIQYTLAVDRADESVAHLYDPLHPAVLQLVAQTVQAATAAGKAVSVCGEMAGDTRMTRLLLGLGLRVFSMHPAQILAVKKEVREADTRVLAELADEVIDSDNPAVALEAVLAA
jgi:phosphoenolpyruvate-protein phosphotransferase (PTS system enzyme I)